MCVSLSFTLSHTHTHKIHSRDYGFLGILTWRLMRYMINKNIFVITSCNMSVCLKILINSHTSSNLNHFCKKSTKETNKIDFKLQGLIKMIWFFKD
jgi:hypothetical protein